VCLNVIPLGPELEENFGLDLLFGLRGTRRAPSDVVIVSIDKASADALNLPDDPRKWPRSLHANLTEKLSSNGAAVIAFDVIFADKHSAKEDNLFAQALRKANNVVLCEAMKVENVPLPGGRGLPGGELNITKVLSPIRSFSQSAVATAPFPVPKVSNKVSQYWMFTKAAGDKPTLPVLAFQVSMMQVYDDFVSLLKKVSPDQASLLPSNRDRIINGEGIEGLIRNVRYIFQNGPPVAVRMLDELHNSKTLISDKRKYRLIDSLIRMYGAVSPSRYLNFYGPARTIRTIPYYEVLQMDGGASVGKQSSDIKGKAVFVGLSQLSPVDQKESFFTVYSRDGLDISGVEIVATAFANLVEDRPVQPIDFRGFLLIIFFWGALLGFISKRFSTQVSFYSMIALMTLYMVFAVYQFKHGGIWYPVITTVFCQPVGALVGGLLWNYIDVKQERQNIRKALGFYLPDDVADGLTRNVENIHSSHQIVFGICLSTDAEQYSSLAEVLPPKELGSFMNKYYETIFKPIKQYGGVISDVIGDSALAIWISSHPEAELKQKACLAALDISKAIEIFNRESGSFRLPTRIGLHAGNILLGNIGAIDHYEYRPVGDIVNTATRIEGLNKQIGTQILATREVVGHLDGFLAREIGEFKLAGKMKPVVVHEIVCRLEESDERQVEAYAVFGMALDAFRSQSWDGAIKGFRETGKLLGGDGPSDFYIRLCSYNKDHEPGGLWDPVIHMEKK
jgi:adenylate cyclase